MSEMNYFDCLIRSAVVSKITDRNRTEELVAFKELVEVPALLRLECSKANRVTQIGTLNLHPLNSTVPITSLT